MTGGPSGRFQSEALGASPKEVSPQAERLSSGVGEPFAPLPSLPPRAPSTMAAPLALLPSQGLYQWIYHTHEDAQEARASQETPGEDPGGEGAREEDQPDSGNRTGGQ